MKCYTSIVFCLLCWISTSGKQAKKPSTKNEAVTLVFVGDINFDGPVRHYVEKRLSTYNTSFELVAKYIREADYAIGNLESPYGTTEMRNHPVHVPVKSAFLLAHPESVEALRFAGIDAVTLANNHMNDFGEDPIALTLQTLKSNGIDSFGVNKGKPDAPQVPLIKNIKGVKIGFLGYCNVAHDPGFSDDLSVRRQFKVGMALYDEELVKRDVDKLKRNNVDIMVVYIHWGKEYQLSPEENQRKMGQFLKSLGFHLIIGAHPHVIQGHGYYGKSFLSYSLGNFLFGQFKTSYPKFQSLPGWLAEKHITEDTFTLYEREATRSLSPTKDSVIFKVQVIKDGTISASYLPCEIQFNVKKKSVQLTPSLGPDTEWIDVCSKHDNLCLENDKQKNRTKNRKP